MPSMKAYLKVTSPEQAVQGLDIILSRSLNPHNGYWGKEEHKASRAIVAYAKAKIAKDIPTPVLHEQVELGHAEIGSSYIYVDSDVCPGCHQEVHQADGEYCPHCGLHLDSGQNEDKKGEKQ